MKKYLLLLLAVILISSISTIALADILPLPTLTLQVTIADYSPNVTYTATLKNWVSSTSVPVITFYCNNVAVGSAQIDNSGVATLRLSQQAGKYSAQSAWLNTPNPIRSNIVTYTVPLIP